MNVKPDILRVLVIATLVGAGQVNADFFDKQGGQPQGDVSAASRVVACALIKTSYKGENEGLFSDAKKSVEATCLLRGGGKVDFSATMAQWQQLRGAAGLPVTLYLSRDKLPDAKTDWALLGLTPVGTDKPSMTKLCGPADGQSSELAGKKLFSRGFRVGEAVEVEQQGKDGWGLKVLLGFDGATPWLEREGSLVLGRDCAAQHVEIVAAHQPMVFVYAQPDDDPDYVVEEIYRIQGGGR